LKLGAYIIRRLLLLIPVLLGVSIFIFTLTRIGGDPAAAYIHDKMTEEQIAHVYEKFHLNEPVYVQYWYWLDGILHGDWGYSKTARAPVTTAIARYFPATFELTLISIVIAVTVGIALGTISAVKRDKPVDHATRVMALSGVSLPIFWLGLMLQYVFFYKLRWFPPGGRYDELLYLQQGPIQKYTGFWTLDTLLNGNLTLFGDALLHIALPAITLSFGTIAIITRIMRSSMLEVLGQEYIKTARSKGLPEKIVIKRHARKNALIPTTTVVGLSFGGLLGGAVLTETIYSWPGMGQWSTAAIITNDWASILGFVLITAIIYVIANLIVDILYAFLDPRVRLG
jgi:peptide/nickel transport system permease protein